MGSVSLIEELGFYSLRVLGIHGDVANSRKKDHSGCRMGNGLDCLDTCHERDRWTLVGWTGVAAMGSGIERSCWFQEIVNSHVDRNW